MSSREAPRILVTNRVDAPHPIEERREGRSTMDKEPGRRMDRGQTGPLALVVAAVVLSALAWALVAPISFWP